MAQNFYSVAIAVLATILVRWCVSLSSYSGKFSQKMTDFFTPLSLVVKIKIFFSPGRRERKTSDVWRLRSTEALDGDHI